MGLHPSMQFRVEALPAPQEQPARNPLEGQRRLPPQPRGDRQFDRVALEPLLKASFRPAQPPQFLRQNPLAFGFRALPLQLPSVVLPQFAFHPLQQLRFELRPSQTPPPPDLAPPPPRFNPPAWCPPSLPPIRPSNCALNPAPPRHHPRRIPFHSAP